MIDLQSLSSNLLLVGFALVSICCLYLLYSNFTKVREIEDLKNKVEDLKNIFFNQQKHNDETYGNIMNLLQKDLNQISSPNNLLFNNLSSNNLLQNDIKCRETSTKLINSDTTLTNNKSINIDLQELDDMDDMDDIDELNDELENLSNLDIDDINQIDSVDDIDIPDIEDNIFNSSHLIKTTNIDIVDIIDDTNSIATDPMISELDLNEIMEGSNEQDLDQDLENSACKNSNEDNECNDDEDNEDNECNDDDNDNDNDDDDEDNDILENLDLDNLDLDNLEIDLDTNNEINLNKQVNIDNTVSLSDTIINQSTMKFEYNNDVKQISVTETNANNDSKIIKTELETETIELDKLLSGEIKKVEISHNNDLDLNSMSIKQLKELAKTHNIKISGNKKDLITALSDIKQ